MSSALSLVADIGGTNTRVALARAAVVDPGSIRRYPNAEAPDMATVIRRYLDDTGTAHSEILGACVAAAGPVHDGVADLTNLDWRIDRDVLSDVLTADHVAVLNDLQAQGHALDSLQSGALHPVLHPADPATTGTKLVVGVGTGFNAAPIYDTGAGRVVPPSECGHISLPVSRPDDAALAAQLRATHGFAAVEEALSGRGVEAIDRHLHGGTRRIKEVMAALGTGDREAEATAAMFVHLLGTVVGDLALIHLPFGGIYLVGGVSRAFAPYLDRFGFAEAMLDKGRFGPFLRQFGVTVVTDDYAALTGCAAHLVHLKAG